MSRDEVIEVIRNAFAGTPPPNRDQFAHCDACEIWLERFLESCPATWEELRPNDISYECEALTAVTPKAWRFLLPGYLVWHLQNYDRSDSNTVEYLIYQLTLDEHTDSHIIECYAGLSARQCTAVHAFLAFVASQSYDSDLAADAAKALTSYWAMPASARGFV